MNTQMPTQSKRIIYLGLFLQGIYGFCDDTANSLFVLEMPLAHKKSSVIFIMPYHVESLERLEKMLSRKQLDTWQSKMEQRAVAVSLPKVSMEVSHNLQVGMCSTPSTTSTPALVRALCSKKPLSAWCLMRERISLQ